MSRSIDSASKPAVVYWNNMPTPYVVGRLGAVAARGNINIEAWFNQERASDRSWSVSPEDWQFPARYIPSVRVAGQHVQIPNMEIRAVSPDLLITLYESPSFVLGASLARSHTGRLAFRVLPTFDSWIQRSKVKEAAKRLLFHAGDAAKVPGPAGAKVAEDFGLPQSRIHPVTQSIDVEHYAQARAMAISERTSGRRARGLHGCVFLYIGRLWSGKGLDTLFTAFAEVRSQGRDVSLLVVGDGVEEERYRDLARSMSNVHFEGFVQPSDLPEIYGLADVFVFPTLGDPHGLVVEEAMAAGLPVIASESAGDIRHRLPDGEAGYLVPPNDSKSLAERMLRLANNPRLRQSMADIGCSLVIDRDHEAYARDFERFVETTLSMPARSGAAAAAVRAMGGGLMRILRDRPVAPLVTE